MYTLPPDFDFSFLMNREIETVSFGKYCANISFGEDAWIGIESGFKHSRGDIVLQEAIDFPVEETSLVRLAGESIVSVEVVGKANLELNFSNGDTLIISGENEMYECYSLYDGETETII